MMYTVYLAGGQQIDVTEEELQNILSSEGIAHIGRLGVGVRRNSIGSYVPKDEADKYNRAGNTHGVLHDGTKVVRHFGKWYVDGYYIENSKGQVVPEIVIDPNYYPEVAQDNVPTPEEFREKYEQLPEGERLKAMGVQEKKQIERGASHIGDVLPKPE